MTVNFSKPSVILSTGALYHLPLSLFFSAAKEAGFDGVELIVDDKPDSTDLTALKELISGHDLPIYSVHIPMENCSIFGHDAEPVLGQTASLAQAVGAQKVIIHPARTVNKEYAKQLPLIIKKMESRFPLELLIENIPKQIKGALIAEQYYHPRRLMQIFQSLCLDTSHLATTKLPFKSVARAALQHIQHVHFSDSNLIEVTGKIDAYEDEHLPPGSGVLPLPWLSDRLAERGYDGSYCLEMRPMLFDGMSISQITEQLLGICQKVKKMVEKRQSVIANPKRTETR